MSFTEKKFITLSKGNKLKKTLFTVKQFINGKADKKNAVNLLLWLNRHEDFNFSLPESVYDWSILSEELLQILKIENHYTESSPFDEKGNNSKMPVQIILESIRSPFNTGSIMRTGEAFGVEKINLCGITPNPAGNKKVNKTLKNSQIEYKIYDNAQNCIKNLIKQNYKIYALEKTRESISMENSKFDFPCAVILGNEEFGINPKTLELCHEIYHISMKGFKNSINVSVCAGIGLFKISSYFNKA